MQIFDKVETHYIVKLDEYGTSIHIIESLKNCFHVLVYTQYDEVVIEEQNVLSPDAKTVLCDFLNKIDDYTYITNYYDVVDIQKMLLDKFKKLKDRLDMLKVIE